MTEVTVNSRLCGFTHKIKGQMEGDKVIIDIDTPCEKIKNLSHMEVPMMELFDIKDNYVMEKAKEADCTSICLVPCGVLHVCRIEAGLLSKRLAENVGSVDITFE
ncbi:conserved hypothetical protein [Methanohalobium evestigatum Z-7303]|uniref:Uncharacterized protein n=1 Tax=Methanohalobium evestigatum (strain ATCC BAA-1072 / DSM 3721 / NBRC 107634 / OCM 161 / Z-7303) TaxID=644295 RepID=D7EB26_METEZ|nr:hypothetical protein [Methanohalobium evestigatum]ADI74543.1 conserved hypothetical protein [Methanohalobium evestigatum Z-7303]